MQKAPIFSKAPLQTEHGFPTILPALPVRYQNEHNGGEVSIQNVIERLNTATKQEIEAAIFSQATVLPCPETWTLAPHLDGALFLAFRNVVQGAIKEDIEDGGVRNESAAIRQFSQSFLMVVQF